MARRAVGLGAVLFCDSDWDRQGSECGRVVWEVCARGHHVPVGGVVCDRMQFQDVTHLRPNNDQSGRFVGIEDGRSHAVHEVALLILVVRART